MSAHLTMVPSSQRRALEDEIRDGFEDSMQAMRDANPRDTEEFSNTHDVSSVWVDDTGGK